MQNKFREQKGLLGLEDEQSQSEAALFWNAFSAGTAARNEKPDGVLGSFSPEAYGAEFFKTIGSREHPSNVYPLKDLNATKWGGFMSGAPGYEKPNTTEEVPFVWKQILRPVPRRSNGFVNSSKETAVVNGMYREYDPYSAAEFDPNRDKHGEYLQVGIRPLETNLIKSLGAWLNFIRIPILEKYNILPCHEQIIENGTNRNYGKSIDEKSKNEKFNRYIDKDLSNYDFSSFRYGDKKYSTKLLRFANYGIYKDKESTLNKPYNPVTNNCQVYVKDAMTKANNIGRKMGRKERYTEYTPDDFFRRYSHGMRIGNTIWQG